MSSTRLSSLQPRGRAAVAAALAALALVASCGTTHAGSAGSASTPASTATARVGASTPTPTPTGTASANATASAPATATIRVPLVLPASGRVVGAAPGSVSGVVTLGLDRCLFLRTDAGQRFGLGGDLAGQVRTLMIGRGVPVPEHRNAPTDLPGTSSVRIIARGTVTAGASVCSTLYQFTAVSGNVVSSVIGAP